MVDIKGIFIWCEIIMGVLYCIVWNSGGNELMEWWIERKLFGD